MIGAAILIASQAATLDAKHFDLRSIEPPEVRAAALLQVVKPCKMTADGDEIVVCGRKDQDRYRLPFRNGAPELGSPASYSVASERHRLFDIGNSGIGSCSTDGAGGWTGCMVRQWRESELQGRRSRIRF
jgi:hypothetical protein